MKFFDCKYPIIEAVMNQGSTLDLAIAIHNAGAFPSLFLDTYPLIQYEKVQDQLNQFKYTTNSTNLVVPIDRYLLLDHKYVKLLHDFGPSHIEILPSDYNGVASNGKEFLESPLVISALKLLRTKSKIILRIYEPIVREDAKNIDALTVKGKESAGKTGNWSVKELFLEQQQLTPEIPVIPYGGIGSPDQVKWYLSHGAVAVGVGTMFAASAESPLSTEVKKKMINATSKDLTCLNDTRQNCLVFGEIDNKNWNRNFSLNLGVNGNGHNGHVYVGNAIDNIDRIRTANETVEFLCSTLK